VTCKSLKETLVRHNRQNFSSAIVLTRIARPIGIFSSQASRSRAYSDQVERLIDKNMRQFRKLEHVLAGKAGPLFRNTLN
jgi:hypothetical protein